MARLKKSPSAVDAATGANSKVSNEDLVSENVSEQAEIFYTANELEKLVRWLDGRLLDRMHLTLMDDGRIFLDTEDEEAMDEFMPDRLLKIEHLLEQIKQMRLGAIRS